MSEVAFSFDRVGTALVLGIGIPLTLYQAYLAPSPPHIDNAVQIKITPPTSTSPNVGSDAATPSHASSAPK